MKSEGHTGHQESLGVTWGHRSPGGKLFEGVGHLKVTSNTSDMWLLQSTPPKHPLTRIMQNAVWGKLMKYVNMTHRAGHIHWSFRDSLVLISMVVICLSLAKTLSCFWRFRCPPLSPFHSQLLFEMNGLFAILEHASQGYHIFW